MGFKEFQVVVFRISLTDKFLRFCENTTVSKHVWKVETFAKQGENIVAPKMRSALQAFAWQGQISS